ncbi:MAG: DUF1232 domain-containing protein [Candidatus Riflebacteria bacterium]
MTKPEPSIPKSLIANPKAQLILFIFTIIYIVSPVDFIPDIAPIIGWADDAAVLLTQLVSFILYLKQKRQNINKNEGNNDGS